MLISDELDGVLCDFGLASFIQESGVSSGLTTSRTTKETARYMSPEFLLDEAKDLLKSDVWAWGCTTFEVRNYHMWMDIQVLSDRINARMLRF